MREAVETAAQQLDAVIPTLKLPLAGNKSYFFFFSPCKRKAVTWQRTAEDLHSHADAAAAEPGARVDSDVSGNHWS